MILRRTISAVSIVFITAAVVSCVAALDADSALRPDHPTTNGWRDDMSGNAVTTPPSFTMADLTTLSLSEVAIEPIEGAGNDEIVVEDDVVNAFQAAEEELALPADDREMYNVARAGGAQVRSITPLVAPAADSTHQRTIHVDADKNSQRTMPAALRDATAAQKPITRAHRHEYRPQVQQTPLSEVSSRPKAPPTLCEDGPQPSTFSPPTPRLRPAYRMHIRANGQGLEPFLHKLIAAMAAFKGDPSPATPLDDGETDFAPHEEEQEEKGTRGRPRPQQTTPPFENLEDPGEVAAMQDYPSYAVKATKTQLPEDATTSFWGRRDEFSITQPPVPHPKPAHSKLIGIRVVDDSGEWAPGT